MYGGSGKGVMGAVAAGAGMVDGAVVGVTTKKIHALGHHEQGADLLVTDTMSQRKDVMWSCDAFLTLPGGVGTLDELFEIWTLIKLGYRKPKPIVVWNYRDFYRGLWNQLRDMIDGGTMPTERVSLVTFCNDLDMAIEALGDPHV